MFSHKRRNSFINKVFVPLILAVSVGATARAQKDTLRVMAYNVLYYGNGCQGPTTNYHNYLKTITRFTNPDILSLEKLASIRSSADDKAGTAPVGFADSILYYALNAAFPSRYAYCPFTNHAQANNQCVVFYDQRKLGFVSLVASYVNATDFNTYKLYCKDPNLAKTHDTTFLYITPNHNKSGDEFEDARTAQITGEMKSIMHHFSSLANHINLGDFNVRSSEEDFYKLLTTTGNFDFRFCDPPFYIDKVFKYPANWDHDGKFSAYFTTSTREMGSVPNTCGSGGGGKNWYDHIFLSPWIVNNTNYIKYIPHSYRTIGNDGQRYKVSILNRNSHVNTSAPAEVLEALYQMSNKYPVMVDLEVTSNTTGLSPRDPELPYAQIVEKEDITIPGATHLAMGKSIKVILPDGLTGQELTIEIFDKEGISQQKTTLIVKDLVLKLRNKLAPGSYSVKCSGKHNLIADISINVD